MELCCFILFVRRIVYPCSLVMFKKLRAELYRRAGVGPGAGPGPLGDDGEGPPAAPAAKRRRRRQGIKVRLLVDMLF